MIHLLTALLLYIMKICGLHNFHSKCDISLGGFTIVLGGWRHFFGEYLLLPFELKPTHETCFMQDLARQGDKKSWIGQRIPASYAARIFFSDAAGSVIMDPGLSGSVWCGGYPLLPSPRGGFAPQSWRPCSPCMWSRWAATLVGESGLFGQKMASDCGAGSLWLGSLHGWSWSLPASALSLCGKSHGFQQGSCLWRWWYSACSASQASHGSLPGPCREHQHQAWWNRVQSQSIGSLQWRCCGSLACSSSSDLLQLPAGVSQYFSIGFMIFHDVSWIKRNDC